MDDSIFPPISEEELTLRRMMGKITPYPWVYNSHISGAGTGGLPIVELVLITVEGHAWSPHLVSLIRAFLTYDSLHFNPNDEGGGSLYGSLNGEIVMMIRRCSMQFVADLHSCVQILSSGP